MTPLPFDAARRCVIDRVRQFRAAPKVETLPLIAAIGRTLARDIQADRAYPPFARSIRDGFAIHSQSFSGTASLVGEVRAGQSYSGRVGPGEAVEIMTGAPVPEGADAIVMVEHVSRRDSILSTEKRPQPGDFISPEGTEACAGEVVLEKGERLDFARIGVLATVGITEVPVYATPRVTIVATGDELVEPGDRPGDFQIRNSNSYALAAQVTRAGGEPFIAPVARDDFDSVRSALRSGLQSDLLLLSGGVSAGKYDLVEQVLAEMGAEFFFDRVLIQPGQPVVFGRASGSFFFGLPGNPASTAVTFEAFARAAVELLGGSSEAPLTVTFARIRGGLTQKRGLTRFLPARLSDATPEVTLLKYGGSGDIFALGRSNAFVIARADREVWEAGDLIEVLAR